MKKLLSICGLFLAMVLTLSVPVEIQSDSKPETLSSAVETSQSATDTVSNPHADDTSISPENSQEINPADSQVSDDVAQIDEEFRAWEEMASIVTDEETVYYKGGLYTKDYTKLVKWPVLSDEEIEQFDIERKSHPLRYYSDEVHLYPENFHPNLKVIGAEAFAGNLQVIQVVIPWGVEEIHARVFKDCSMSVYIPDTAIRISSDNDDSATIGTYLTYNYSPTNTAACTALNYNTKHIDEHADNWRAMYGITEQSWQLLDGQLYCFRGDSRTMLTGTRTVDGVTYHFAETGELLSAEMPEGDYELSTFGIHVDDNGNVTVTTAYNPNSKIIPGTVYGNRKSSPEPAVERLPDGTIRYKGGIYTADGSTLMSWSLKDAIEDGCEFEYDPWTLGEGKTPCLLVDADTFHPNLKNIRNGITVDERITMIIPWGVTDIEDGTFCDIMCYLPPTAVNITPDILQHTPGSVTQCISSQSIEKIIGNTNMGAAERNDRTQWYQVYDLPLNSWKTEEGFLYYFGADLYSVIRPIPKMLTGTQVINGITYHFAESGELLSAELPEGDYKLDGVEIHVDEQGGVTIKQ